jgi:hypothetical protein
MKYFANPMRTDPYPRGVSEVIIGKTRGRLDDFAGAAYELWTFLQPDKETQRAGRKLAHHAGFPSAPRLTHICQSGDSPGRVSVGVLQIHIEPPRVTTFCS